MIFLEILAAVAAGAILGIFTGLTPGVHINLVAAIILSLSPMLLQYFSPISLASAIMAMSITHVFIDFIPSIFLGAPSDATALAVLPGHKMLLQGRGYEAVALSATGGFFGLAAVILALPLLLITVKYAFAAVKPYIGIVLAGIVLYNVLLEKKLRKKFWSLIIFILAGILGMLTLAIPNLNQPLLPLLAGLFGLSTLLSSMIKSTAIPIQAKGIEEIEKSGIAKSIAAGAFSGGLMGIFPALGPAQAAMLARNLIGKAGKRAYLITLGAVSTSSMIFGLITLFTIDKARNGSIAMLSEIIPVDSPVFMLLIAVAATTAGIALALALLLGKTFAMNIYRIDYKKISLAIVAFVAVLTFYFSQFIGLLILATGTAIGLFTITKGIARHNLMGCLMLPVISYYL